MATKQGVRRPSKPAATKASNIAANKANPEVSRAKSDVLKKSLKRFYTDPRKLTTFSLITVGEPQPDGTRASPISLRLLDWLVTNYAKKRNIVYCITRNGVPHAFNVWVEYRSQLKAYSKQYFDIFCRRERTEIENAYGETQKTTIAQQNFCKWAITNGVIDYALHYKDIIERDMKIFTTVPPADEEDSPDVGGMTATPSMSPSPSVSRRTRRHELSPAAVKSCTKTYCKVVVKLS